MGCSFPCCEERVELEAYKISAIHQIIDTQKRIRDKIFPIEKAYMIDANSVPSLVKIFKNSKNLFKNEQNEKEKKRDEEKLQKILYEYNKKNDNMKIYDSYQEYLKIVEKNNSKIIIANEEFMNIISNDDHQKNKFVE